MEPGCHLANSIHSGSLTLVTPSKYTNRDSYNDQHIEPYEKLYMDLRIFYITVKIYNVLKSSSNYLGMATPDFCL